MDSKIIDGYTIEEAIIEANRCLKCKVPSCMVGCPAHVHIPDFIEKIKDINFMEAYNIIVKNNCLPSITSRVCYTCNQCEGHCALGKTGEPINIGKLEKCATDYINDCELYNKCNFITTTKKINVSIVGAGVAGLSCAIVLAKGGCNVTIYEKENDIGGVARYEIPNARFDKSILDELKMHIATLKIDVIYDKVIGKDIKLLDLRKEADYIILASGTGNPHILGIEGETEIIKNEVTNGTYRLMYASEFLKLSNKNSNFNLSGKVVIIGGGNTALDAARTAKLCGSDDVSIYYRRTEEKMPCRTDELESTKAEGINFRYLVTPNKVRYNDKGKLVVTFSKTRLMKDENSIEKVIEARDSEFEEEIDYFIMASGSEPNHYIYSKEITDLELDKYHNIKVNDRLNVGNTNNLFAVGDLVTGSFTVVNAIKMGMEAANNILKELV